MHQFKQAAPTALGLLEFSFTKILCGNKIKYHVEVNDPAGITHHFSMVEKFGHWKIIAAPQPPDWIMGAEPVLALLLSSEIEESGNHHIG